eukprot:Gb_22525 [translate_table: standard]
MEAMDKYKPHLAMLAVQFAYAGLCVTSKAALNKGMNQFVFVVYRHIIAALLLSPFAYFLERRERPSLTFWIFSKIFVLALCGVTIQQNLYLAGLNYTSATFACALSNVIPAMTFVIAVLCRMERVNFRSMGGQARVLGTLVCIGGALIVTLYKGPVIRMPWSPLVHHHHTNDPVGVSQDWLKGSLFIIISYITYSLWLIQQANIMKEYPAQLSMTTLLCLLATVQSAVVAVIFERKPAAWALQWNFQLLNVVYAGIMTSGGVYCLQTWCIGIKGPVFAAMFIPVSLVIVAFMSSILLAELLHLGSLVGGFLVVIGLYFVLWGKSKDMSTMARH